MPAFAEHIQDRRSARRNVRSRRKRKTAASRKARRTAVLKAVAVAVALAACVFLALFVGDGDYKATAIGWTPLISVVLVCAVSFAYLQALKRGIVFEEVSELGECQRMRDIRFRVRLRNKLLLPVFRMEAHFYVNDLFGNPSSRAATTLSLGPRESHELGFSASFEHIGTYAAGLEKIVICDFLNLFTATVFNPRQREVCVTPRLERLDGIRFANDALVEATKATKTVLADSMDYAFVREYVQGDPLKTIHWNLSTRGMGYMTRLFEMPTNPSVGIVMDFYAPDTEAQVLMSLFDAVVESALSLGDAAWRQGLDAELHYRSRYGEDVCLTSWRIEDFPKLVEDLPAMSNDAAQAPQARAIVNSMMSAPDGVDTVVICTANPDAALCGVAMEAKLRRRMPFVVAVVPPGCVAREREDRVAALARLDAADIRYCVITSAEDLHKEVG